MWIKRASVGAVALAALGVGLTACGSSPSGYNNPQTLDKALARIFEQRTGGVERATVNCTPTVGLHAYNCAVVASENGILVPGYPQSVLIQVSPGGQSWSVAP